MLISDSIDFVPKKEYKQKGPTCSVHGFFTLLSEHIQQDTGEWVEFDMYKYFDEMEADRGRTSRMAWLIKHAAREGFKTTDGRLVKVKGYRSIPRASQRDIMAYRLQASGPLYIAIRRYYGHDLTPRGNVIGPVPEGAKKKKIGHALIIRGRDAVNELYKLHDSKGKGSVNWIPFDVLEDICYRVYSIYKVTIEE